MLKVFRRLILKSEIHSENINKKQEFFDSLRELVTILFAVVLAVGLSELSKYHLKDFWQKPSFYWFVLANMAVIMSWWGYHQGIVFGPKETNILSYAVDCILVVLYWCLINKRENLVFILTCYFLMFVLYWVWELVRSVSSDNRRVVEAKSINLMFSFIIVALLSLYMFLGSRFVWLKSEWIYIFAVLVIIFLYRKVIYSIYLEKEDQFETMEADDPQISHLIEIAREVANNAKAHISNFHVGAAILTKNGNIYKGCNVEFDNFSNTIHAEESVICQMIKEGESDPVMIAVFTFTDELNYPCGMCRQSLFEIGGPELIVVACNTRVHESKTMKELMPAAFKL